MATLIPDGVPRRENLSFEEFDRCYLRKNLPVVLVGALNEWPALEKWTPEFFADTYQGKKVQCLGEAEATTMDAYISQLKQSNVDKPLVYLRNLDIQTDFPELVPDISPVLPYATPDWLGSPFMPWLKSNYDVNQLFISGLATRISLHYDEWMIHNTISNIYGSKRFILFNQDQSEYLYRRADHGDDYIISMVDPWDWDEEQFPDYKNATGYEVTIDKGDTVFIPSGWWHSTYTTSTCISVCTSFANESNWPALIEEIARLRERYTTLKGKCKTIAFRSYLKALGLAMGMLQPVRRPPY